MHLQVIQSGENALLRYPETPGKDSEIQAVIRLQHIAKQVADQTHHLIIVSCLKCFIQRDIILINQQDGLLAVMFFEKQGEGF